MARVRSLTNADTLAAFRDGREGHNARDSLRSIPEEGRTELYSYQTLVAVRRERDDQTFYSAHRYSSTTAQQLGWRNTPELSFDCMAELIGPRWWDHLEPVDHGPRPCRSPICQRLRDARSANHETARIMIPGAYQYGAEAQAEPMPGDPDPLNPVSYPSTYEPGADTRCWAPVGTPGHGLPTVPGYDSPWVTAHLLRVDVEEPDTVTGQAAGKLGYGQHYILTGHEPGKREQYGGRTDQLWAAIVPNGAFPYGTDPNLPDAFASLRPDGVGADAKRQGDLWFLPYHGRCACPCHEDRRYAPDQDEHDARIAPLLTKAGRWTRHGCDLPGVDIPDVIDLPHGGTYEPGSSRVGATICKGALLPPAHAARIDGLELPAKGGRHKPARVALTPSYDAYASGPVDHPEHPTLRLRDRWHKVTTGRAVVSVAARYYQPMGNGRGGYAD